MTSLLKTTPTPAPAPSEQDAPQSLTPLLSRRWALSGLQFSCLVLFAGLYLVASYVPLPMVGLLNHVAVGHSVLQDRALPAVDPMVPLTEGMDYSTPEWLSQILFAGVQRAIGLEGLTFFFAAATLLTGLLVFGLMLRQGAPLPVAMLSLVACVGLAAGRILMLRPESLGLIGFVLLLHILESARQSHRPGEGIAQCVAVTFLFAAWVNLHSSFAVGLSVLGVLTVASLIEQGLRTRSFTEALRSSRFRRALYLFECAVVGSLLNPHGGRFVLDSLLPFWTERLASADERGLLMTSFAGLSVGVSVLGTMALLRVSRVPFDRSWLVDWLALGISVSVHQNHLTWFVLATIVLWQPHLSALWREWRPVSNSEPDPATPPTAKEFRLSLVGLLVIWLAFVFSPVNRLLLGGKPRSPQRYLQAGTPIELGRYLAQNPVRGLILNPEGWGDWLSYVGGSSQKLYLTTLATPYLPRMVRQDYLNMNRGDEHLESLLEKYRIGSVVVDRDQQAVLEKQLRKLPGWSVAFENETALLMQRTALNKSQTNSLDRTVSRLDNGLPGWCQHD